MSADVAAVQAGNGAGKVRLLSLGDVDRRTAAYRRTVELISHIETDLGGADRLSTAERALIRRAGVTAALAEHLETRWLSGEEIDPGMYCTVGNALRRLLESVGLKRVPRDVGTLYDYLASLPSEDEAAASDELDEGAA
jgi:hypothetical protein